MIFKKTTRNIAKFLCLAMGAVAITAPLTACKDKTTKRTNEDTPLTLATDKLDSVFNPFFYTAGADGEIVSQTQVGMLSSDDNGLPLASWNEPSVSHAYSYVTTGSYANSSGGTDYSKFYTEYYFALKDNVRFSDGSLLTKDDVLFNIYMYLDPAYTGSNTMYSVKIRGLQAYRTNTYDATSGSQADIHYQNIATGRYQSIQVWAEDEDSNWNNIKNYDYYFQTSENPNAFTDDMMTIVDDIEMAEYYYKQSIISLWNSAEASNIEDEFIKYKDINGDPIFTQPWQVFLYYSGTGLFQVNLEYDRNNNPYYKSVVNYDGAKDKDTLTDFVYQAAFGQKNQASKNYKSSLLSAASSGDLFAYLKADAQSHEITQGERVVKKIDGIEIIKDNKIPVISTRGAEATDYEYQDLKDAEGNVKEYEILKITIDGIDPKAIQNFSFTVAPGKYYSDAAIWDKAVNDNDADDEFFGVEFSNTKFMERVQQKQLPLGAGPYKASTSRGGVATDKGEFLRDGIVYFERNDYFMLGKPVIKKLRYKEISSNMLYNSVRTGDVLYGSPNMKAEEVNKITTGQDKDILRYVLSDNLGYGYIGVSARYIPNIYIRKAIMSTFDAQSCVDYYNGTDYASVITRPMSKTLEGYYPEDAEPYYEFDPTGNTAKEYLVKGGCRQDGDGKWMDKDGNYLKYTFTIAGDTDDHPANALLTRSKEILNTSVGMEINVTHSSRALSDLAAGNLTVWAAAWSSSSDPDMYQVYHKDSKATSTRAWGYNHIFGPSFVEYAGPDNYDQKKLIEDLSVLIQQGRDSMDKADREPFYWQALDMLMDLAVEFPTYQRKVFYVWQKGVFDESTMDLEASPYHSPFSRIWEVSFNEN